MSYAGDVARAATTNTGTILPAKGSPGKNDAHINQERKAAANKAAAEAKTNLENLQKKPNKTPQDKKDIDKAKRNYDHLKKQAEATGENHSQRKKGN
ncbi:MAG TPA: hypothetical protein VK533_14340 [Sphingomonas sp.]|nr:hypothetical protein [Sphingomonas sp.]